MIFPWEQLPAAQTVPELPAQSTEDTVKLLQRDVAYMITHTAVFVHSNNAALEMLVNTARCQIVPRGKCRFTDGTTMEFQDIGMPQIGAPAMTVAELLARIWDVAGSLGLEIET